MVWKNLVGGKRFYNIGRRYEYILMNELKKLGYFVMRSPASGRGTKNVFYPDIVAIKGTRVYFIEVKYRGDDRDVHMELWKFKKYMEEAEKQHACPVICVYYASLHDWRCIHMNAYTHITKKYVVYEREHIWSCGRSINQFFD